MMSVGSGGSPAVDGCDLRRPGLGFWKCYGCRRQAGLIEVSEAVQRRE